MKKKMAKLLFIATGVFAVTCAQGSISFTPTHLYTTHFVDNTVNEYDSDGMLLASMELSALSPQEDTKGLAFGRNGNLYVVVEDIFSGARLVEINPEGSILTSYNLPVLTGFNASYGKLLFAGTHFAYVGTQSGLVKIDLRETHSAQLIYDSDSIFDVDVLEDGSLVAISSHEVFRMDQDGNFLETLNLTDPGGVLPFLHLGDLRGITVDFVNDYLYLTSLVASSSTLMFDLTTGELVNAADYAGSQDLFLLGDGRLLVGNWFIDGPLILSASDLSELGRLEGDDRMFVTAFIAPVPVPPAILLLVSALAALGWAKRPAARH